LVNNQERRIVKLPAEATAETMQQNFLVDAGGKVKPNRQRS